MWLEQALVYGVAAMLLGLLVGCLYWFERDARR